MGMSLTLSTEDTPDWRQWDRSKPLEVLLESFEEVVIDTAATAEVTVILIIPNYSYITLVVSNSGSTIYSYICEMDSSISITWAVRQLGRDMTFLTTSLCTSF